MEELFRQFVRERRYLKNVPYGSNPETCPVRTLQAWLEQAAIAEGPLLRSINRHGHLGRGRLSGIDVARVVKQLADRTGPGWIRRSMPGTPSGPGTPRRRPSRARRSG